MKNAKIQKKETPVFTTVRVSQETNKKLARAVDKYNDRNHGRNISKDEYLSLLLNYVHQFGIDFDDTEKPLTLMNKLRSSVKSINDSAWAANKQTEKFVREAAKKIDKLCETLFLMIDSGDFNEKVLHPVLKELFLIKKQNTITVKDKEGKITRTATTVDILNDFNTSLQLLHKDFSMFSEDLNLIKENLKKKGRFFSR